MGISDNHLARVRTLFGSQHIQASQIFEISACWSPPGGHSHTFLWGSSSPGAPQVPGVPPEVLLNPPTNESYKVRVWGVGGCGTWGISSLSTQAGPTHSGLLQAMGPYPTWVTRSAANGSSKKNIPVVQAGWASRYLGVLNTTWDGAGLVAAQGGLVLLGGKNSTNPVGDNPVIAEMLAPFQQVRRVGLSGLTAGVP